MLSAAGASFIAWPSTSPKPTAPIERGSAGQHLTLSWICFTGDRRPCRSAPASITCSCLRRRRYRAADQVLARARRQTCIRCAISRGKEQGRARPPAPPAPAGAPITHEPHRLHGDPLTHPLTQLVDLWMTANTGRRRRPNPSPRPSLQEGSESASDPIGHGGEATP
jgi:hypothetical protein